MRGFSKILKTNEAIPEYGYGIITPTSLIVFDGKVGCKSTPRVPILTNLAKKHGTFAIPDMKNFLAKQKLLDQVQSVVIRENIQSLEIMFGTNSKVSFPVILNIGDNYPHTSIPWLDFEETKDFVPITPSFREMSSLLTNEGFLLWQDDIGITIDGDKMLSFDLGVFLTSKLPDNTQKVFVPKRLLDMDVKTLTRIAKVDGGIIVYNEEFQFFTSVTNEATVPEQILELTDRFEAGEKKKIVFTFSKTVWRRIDTFSKSQLNLSIKNNTIYASAGTWSEELGKLDYEDCEFTVSTALMKRWMQGCMNHSMSIDEAGNWLLRGDLRQGGTFYGTATLGNTGGAQLSAQDAGFDILGDSPDEMAKDMQSDAVESTPEVQEEDDDIAGGLI